VHKAVFCLQTWVFTLENLFRNNIERSSS